MERFIPLVILLFSVVLHEAAHGWMAERRGDDTARLLGRITLNPLPHIDLFGTILVPLLCVMGGLPVFGWAKPVPVNMNRLPRRSDMALVSWAGPMANLTLAAGAGAGLWIVRVTGGAYPEAAVALLQLLQMVLLVNSVLFVFNLLPIPPLDGGHVLEGLLPYRLAERLSALEPYGMFIVIGLTVSGLLWGVLGPAVRFMIWLLGGGAW